MYQAFLSYIKGLFGLHPEKKTYVYFNPEGDFQDIRGLQVIDDITLLPFFISVIILFCFFCWGIYRLIKHIRYKRSIALKVVAKKYLISLDLENAKECAYAFSKWSPFLLMPKNRVLYENIELLLFKYKYKKETQPLTLVEKEMLKTFLDNAHG
jgi:hypothetical protein